MNALLNKIVTASVVGSAALALTMPKAHAQNRMMHTRTMSTPRQLSLRQTMMTPAQTTMNRTRSSLPRDRFVFDPFRHDRFAIDRFLRREFGFDPFLVNRFGFDPFLRNGFGFDPFLASRFGLNPFLMGGGFSSVGSSVTPSFAGGSSGFSGGGAVVSSGEAGSLTDEAKALLLAEQARAERLANRRRIFDEYLYESEKTPTAEDKRQRYDLEQVNRSLHNPPVTEILSGTALNNILRDLCKQSGTEPTTLPLDQAQLRHINVTRVRGNIALLKNDGRFRWPVALLEAACRVEREHLAFQAIEAVSQAKTDKQVDAELIRQMTAHVDGLHQKLRKQAGKLSSSQYIEANSFLDNLDQATVALTQPDVASHFDGTYALTGRSVPELVQQMSRHGLEFARALPGDEAAYVLLHQALAASAPAVRTKVAAR